ncbi:single-stranded DNA-binding protein [Tenacibaculum maritimum]|uniref:single-stranded DNA-binding protein n=1 Tax=Tenacibaculum maritimum TaxID=107401 RepID=UPI0038773711
MSSLKNSVTLFGNILNNPKLIPQSNNRKLVVFNFNVVEDYKDSNRKKRVSATIVNVIAWNEKAQYIYDNLKKGTQIAIDGRIKTRQLKIDRNTEYKTEVQIDEFLILNT